MATLDEYAKAGIQAVNDKKFDVAIESFTKALELGAERPDLTNALGMAYLHRGEVGSAIPHLEKAVQLAEPYDAPEHQDLKVQFHQGLATAYTVADRVPDARRVLEAAVERWPDQVGPRLQLGQLLLSSCLVDDGIAVYRALATHPKLDPDRQKAAKTVAEAIVAFQESEHPASIFLQGHADSYRAYFDEASAESVENGWYAEAARMARGADGEARPIVPKGARPYAMQRVDLVNPADGTVASVYSESEPMVVALNGLEPLAQLPIMFPWKGQAFPMHVCSRCPWHWLTITIQFEKPIQDVPADLDQTVGEWYLAGFNGDFGEKDTGRFHYITDPEIVGLRAVSYNVDLGRAKYDAIEALVRRLAVLHERRAIRRVLFGQGQLPD